MTNGLNLQLKQEIYKDRKKFSKSVFEVKQCKYMNLN